MPETYNYQLLVTSEDADIPAAEVIDRGFPLLDLLENANDLIQSVDEKGSFLFVNRAWKETMGYSDEEIARLKVFDVISPACRDHCSLLFQEIIQGRSVRRVDVQFTAKDGKVVELEGSINCSKMEGRPAITRGIFRDVTDRKIMERELQQSEDRYRKLFQHAPDAIVVHCDGTFIDLNDEACRLFAIDSPGQVIGTPIIPWIHPDSRESVASRIRLSQETGETSSLREARIVRRDGSTVDVEATGTIIMVQGRSASQVILRDITERKLAEAKRAEWNALLERKVEEKTRHLKEAQTKLIQSEKMATLGEVIFGAAHELNNPLAGILGAIQVLRKSTLSQPIVDELMEGIDVLEDIENAALRCQKIVDDLTRFSTQARCNFSQMDLNQVLRDTLEVMDEQFSEMSIQVQWNTDARLPLIDGDFVKLLEVFVNLLQNARSALSHRGTLEIATRVIKKYHEAPQVAVSIRDNGCGIPAHNLKKIFDPFFTTKPVGKGPGLGLTVCYGIIKRHGGEIEVKSTVGKGTEVTVILPVRQSKSG
ncbi:hypothetical protein GMSM_26880 [Geomonas sp. Red276]